MSFFIFKSSYFLLIFIHMHIDFYLVEHNILYPALLLTSEAFPRIAAVEGQMVLFFYFTWFRIYSWNN